MAYEDFESYTEFDEEADVTVESATKVSWDTFKTRKAKAYLYKDKGVNYFSGDFTHKFEVYFSQSGDRATAIFWMLSNTIGDFQALLDANGDGILFWLYDDNESLKLSLYEDGSGVGDNWAAPGPQLSTLYFIEIVRDDDGGANSTGRYTVYIRTGSHTGALQDTLVLDSSVGEQNDFRNIFGMSGRDDNSIYQGVATGFTQNLDIGITRIFDEKFEGAGYEEAGWSETVGAGSTIDEDADPADVSSPSGWGSQCLKIINNGNVTYTKNNVGAEAITHWRIELVLTAESLANSQYNYICHAYDSAISGHTWRLLLEQGSAGNLKFFINSYYDGSAHWHEAFVTPVLNTRYRIEVKWDATNNKWAWRIDGVNQPNDQDASNPVTTEGNLTATHRTDSGYLFVGANFIGPGYTCYYDLIACDDADWVGAEEVEGVAPTGVFYGPLYGPFRGAI